VCVCVCVCVRPCYYEVLRRASKCLPYAFLSLLRSLACLCVKYETDAEKKRRTLKSTDESISRGWFLSDFLRCAFFTQLAIFLAFFAHGRNLIELFGV